MIDENEVLEEELEEQEPIEPDPPQYYADFDAKGNIVGFYVDNIHDVIPETSIPISVEDWQIYVEDASKYKLDDGEIREKTQQELEDEAAARPPAPKSPTQMLQEENAELWYEIMLEKSRNDSHDSDIAHLYYEMMMGGVGA